METELMERIKQPLRHEPIRPARTDHPGEVTMLARWQALMGERCELAWDGDELECPLAGIISAELTQRAAGVAASFVRWLGTGNGHGYLSEGAKLMAAHGRDAYLVAWTLENRRFQGARQIEHILSPASSGLWQQPVISDTDAEVIESIAEWLGTEAGQSFLGVCLAEIEQKYSAERQCAREARLASLLEQAPAAGGAMSA